MLSNAYPGEDLEQNQKLAVSKLGIAVWLARPPPLAQGTGSRRSFRSSTPSQNHSSM